MSFYTTYSNLVPGIEDDNISYFTASGVIPINILGTVGAGGTFLNSEMWKEYTLNGTYALELYHGLSIGGAFKFMGWSASAPPGEDALSYSGFTVDVGAIYTMPEIMKNIDLQIGAAFNNLNNPSIAKSGANSGKLPVKMGLGLALVSNEYNYLFTADIVKESNVYTIKSGVEFNAFKGKMWGYSTDFVIRLGYLDLLASDFAKERALSGGIGIQVDNYRIDYAYRFPFILENLNGSHKISLSFIL
jgi:hypothetical protein